MKILPWLLCAGLLGSACQSPLPEAGRARAAESSTVLKVIPLKYARAAEIADGLKGMLRSTRIVADERTNSLIVAFHEESELAQIERAVAQLDILVTPAK